MTDRRKLVFFELFLRCALGVFVMLATWHGLAYFAQKNPMKAPMVGRQVEVYIRVGESNHQDIVSATVEPGTEQFSGYVRVVTSDGRHLRAGLEGVSGMSEEEQLFVAYDNLAKPSLFLASYLLLGGILTAFSVLIFGDCLDKLARMIVYFISHRPKIACW